MLRLEVRDATIIEVAQFDLGPDEKLEDRVRTELQRASEEGKIRSGSLRMTAPPVRVYDATDEHNSSIALFDMAGNEVTDREHRINSENGSHVVEVRKTSADSFDSLGAFKSFEVASKIGALWRSGVIDE